jgi:hypothetical protein
MKKIVVKCNEELFDKSMELLFKQLGVTEETGKNDGEQVEAYLKSVGLSKGNPYCVAGQYWCFWKACEELNIPKTNIPIVKTGLAVTVFKKALKVGIEVPYEAKVGDLIIWIKPNLVNGHEERIVKIVDDKIVETIGFNTSNGKTGNQREGDGVFYRTRYLDRKLGDMKILGLVGFDIQTDKEIA